MINFIHKEHLKANHFLFLFFTAALLFFSCVKPMLDEDLPPVAAFIADSTSINVNDQVSFTDQSINVPTSWTWSFGDGGTEMDQHPSHTYTSAGVYSVSLTVTNVSGSDTETKADYITVDDVVIPPVAAFTADRTSINENDQVSFTDQSLNSPTSWSWSFGDGGTDTDRHPSHTYTSTGVFTVILTVANGSGSDSETKTDYITVNEVLPPPVAAFAADVTNIREDESVSFTDLSTNSPTSWSWNFGDGGTSIIQHPTHTYETPGVYPVSLTATNASGSDSEIKTDYITAREVVVDIDGNIYDLVAIGNQTWMSENLKVTRYSNGTSIDYVAGDSDWDALEVDDKAYCWYENSTTNRDIYGGLYTWAAAMNGAASSLANPSGVQGVCPAGWHIPSDSEWKQLEMYLGMSQADADDTYDRGTTEGGKLKEEGTTHWNSPNTGATNESGFTAIPGGYRFYNGTFTNLRYYASWLTTTEDEYHLGQYWFRSLSYDGAFVTRNYGGVKEGGASVRCVKD